MNAPAELAVIQQHLIDPEICIRCNTCEATCPVGAITHDSRNYVVDADKCNLCMACVPPCPTGSIDNWRQMPRVRAYSVEEQLTWDELPGELPAEALAAFDVVIKNTAPIPVAVPALELSLTDTRDSVIARRVFLQSELPGSPSLLPAQGSLPLSLRLSITDAGAVSMAGYRVLVFYP